MYWPTMHMVLLRKDEPRPPYNVYPNLKAFDQSKSISLFFKVSLSTPVADLHPIYLHLG